MYYFQVESLSHLLCLQNHKTLYLLIALLIYFHANLEVLGKENEMNLTKIAPSFSLKPIEMNSGQICLPIFDSKKLIAEVQCLLLFFLHFVCLKFI